MNQVSYGGLVWLGYVVNVDFLREITGGDVRLDDSKAQIRWVSRCHGLVGCLLILVMLGGCSIAGQWRTSQRALPLHWMIAEMTLTADGRYTATDLDSANTETGSYKWNGSMLELWPTDGPIQVYAGRVAGDGALLLSGPDSKKDTVRYEKMGE